MAEVRYYLCDWCQKKADSQELPNKWVQGPVHMPKSMTTTTGHFCTKECAEAYKLILPEALTKAVEGYEKEFYSYLRQARSVKK